jgi:hypothetical protein
MNGNSNILKIHQYAEPKKHYKVLENNKYRETIANNSLLSTTIICYQLIENSKSSKIPLFANYQLTYSLKNALSPHPLKQETSFRPQLTNQI